MNPKTRKQRNQRNQLQQPTQPNINPKHQKFLSRLTAAQRPEFYHCLLYGASRSGKTTLVGTAGADERTGPMLLLDFEGGASSVMGQQNVQVVSMRDWHDFNDAYEYLSSGQHPFKSVAVDSISELHMFTVLDIVEKEAAANSRRNEDTAEIQDFGKAMIMLRRFMRHMRQLRMHVFITALTKTDKYPNEGDVRVPQMFGQMAGESVGMFPVVGYLVNEIERVGKGEKRSVRKLYLQNEPGMRIGVRIPLGNPFPDSIANPTITKLFNALDAVYS